jgi:hypothetical protein
MNEDVERKSVAPGRGRQRLFIYAGILLVVFLLGFVPMWLKARNTTNTLMETEHRLFLATIQNDLASAVIDARRGDYEPARQAVSRFFTSSREEVDKGSSSSYTQAQRQAMQPLFAGRDELITLLARSDPASADRLSDLFVAYRKIMNS